MRFLVGDETGIVKSVRVEAQKVEKLGPRRRETLETGAAGYGDSVDRLCWAGPTGGREARFAAGFGSGTIEMRNATTGAVIATATTKPGIKAMEALGSNLLAVSACGAARIVKEWCGDADPADEEEEQEEGVPTPSGRGFTLPGPVSSARLDPLDHSRLVFGGGENDVKIWNVEREEVMWRAKNVREDSLCLRVPVKVSTLQWATQLAPSRSLLLCGTVDGKIRLYDSSAQRRPLYEIIVGFGGVGAGSGGYTGTADDMGRPLLCSAIAPNRDGAWSFFVGNTVGVLREYDLRMLPKSKSAEIPPGRKSHNRWSARQMPFRRGYKGIMGSIRSCELHSTGSALVAAGLGRFAYIFDTKRKKMMSKVFMKQKLCCALMSEEARTDISQSKGSDDDDDSDDETGQASDAGDEEADGETGKGEGADEDEVQEGFSDDGEGEAEAAPKKKKKRKAGAKGAAKSKKGKQAS